MNYQNASWYKTSSNSVKNYSKKILLYNFQQPMDRAIQKCVDFKRLRHINMSKCGNTKGHFFLKRPVGIKIRTVSYSVKIGQFKNVKDFILRPTRSREID